MSELRMCNESWCSCHDADVKALQARLTASQEEVAGLKKNILERSYWTRELWDTEQKERAEQAEARCEKIKGFMRNQIEGHDREHGVLYRYCLPCDMIEFLAKFPPKESTESHVCTGSGICSVCGMTLFSSTEKTNHE